MKKQLASVSRTLISMIPNALFILLLLCFNAVLNAQTLVNKEWVTSHANPMNLDWYSSTMDANNHLISVGNTLVNGQGANVLVQKWDAEGTILWERTYNSSGSNPDFGIGVTTDLSNNVYVCGTTNHNGQFDILVLKYNADGIQQWAIQYNSPFNQNDVATALKTDAAGNTYVAAASEGGNTLSDFLLLKLNTNGANIWQKRYDYAHLSEIPAGLELDNHGNLLIVGASATDFTNWDYALVRYDTEGTLLSAVRNNVAGTGFDQLFVLLR